jgi:hypothetical protein
MTKMLVSMTLMLGALVSPALAGETTVTLAMHNWYWVDRGVHGSRLSGCLK